MNYNYACLDNNQFDGKAIKKASGKEIEIEYLVFNSASMDTLRDILKNGMRGTNQTLYIDELSINKDDNDEFSAGQTSLIKTSNGMSLSAKPIYHTSFNCELQTTVSKNELIYVATLLIPNIVFHIDDCISKIIDESIIYENVKCEIFANCSLVINEE